jgi:hypothetical protein
MIKSSIQDERHKADFEIVRTNNGCSLVVSLWTTLEQYSL